MNTDLAARLRAWRNERGFTQEQSARLVGVTLGTYVRWETGQHAPRGLQKKAVQDLIGETTTKLNQETK